jgi:hypothetical protein
MLEHAKECAMRFLCTQVEVLVSMMARMEGRYTLRNSTELEAWSLKA